MFAKNWRRKLVEGALLSVPWMIVLVPLETTDDQDREVLEVVRPRRRRRLILSVTPSSPRSMPRSPLPKIKFEQDRIARRPTDHVDSVAEVERDRIARPGRCSRRSSCSTRSG